MNFYLRGSGNSARALSQAVSLYHLTVGGKAQCLSLPRQDVFKGVFPNNDDIILIANPHGLHASTLVEAQQAGFRHAIVEKPLCVNTQQLGMLSKLEMDVGVCHGYRLQWGIQEMRRLIEVGHLGKIISLEGHYWQSSATTRRQSSWKDDLLLAGEFDTYLDLGSHWVDLVQFLIGSSALRGRANIWNNNSSTPHRDTHVHLELEWGDGIASLASISKTFHGSGNDLSLTVLGEKGRLTWQLKEPDVLAWGEGAQESTIVRKEKGCLGLAPFHGAGWLEGYAELIWQMARRTQEGVSTYPDLNSSLEVMRTLLERTEIKRIR